MSLIVETNRKYIITDNERTYMQFDNPYQFYKLTESERIQLVEKRSIITFKSSYPEVKLYPILLNKSGTLQNYGLAQGLISCHQPYNIKARNEYWSKIGAFSPDDFDCDLEFTDTRLQPIMAWWKKVSQYLENLPIVPYDYRELLETIQKEFGGQLY